jgi:prepilin-type N-terminal cleavage/methylation domain-containing protein
VLQIKGNHKVLGPRRQGGFSLLEVMVALGIMVAIAGIVMSGMMQMMYVQGSVANRSEMHSSMRSATELMEQEIGQAGRIALPNPVNNATAASTPAHLTLQTDVFNPISGLLCTSNCLPPGTQTVTIGTSGAGSAVAGMFPGIKLTIISGAHSQETVAVTAVNYGANQVTAYFANAHTAGRPILVEGGFAEGVIPADAATVTAQTIVLPNGSTGYTNGSTGYVLKLFGDINGDGNMAYVQYKCTPGTATAPGTLTRSVTTLPQDGTTPAKSAAVVLLDNVIYPTDAAGNSIVTPCFTYDETDVLPDTFIQNVAVTLTVQTALRDAKTHVFQQETKALLNVAPRNVYDTWAMANSNTAYRVQPVPPAVTALIAQP